jgi:5-oxopent-3-ene-1,2,5-tricarboxylate decarboxylase/2-hydroxyhepta-2,4-diene-1,7-dioate isomerase
MQPVPGSRVELTPEALARLGRVSTATLTAQLLARGFRHTFIAGLRPTRPDLRLVGYACTLRYVPAREDVGVRDAKPDNETNVQRRAVESIGEGEVLVVDARGELGAGVLGDILATRIWRRGAAGIVTDGSFRDSPGFAAIDLPAYHRAPNAGLSWLAHHPADLNVPIGCGGVLVLPGDVVVGDAEGVVVVPAQVAEEVAHDAAEQELVEEFALERVRAGESIRSLYPLADERRAEFERWRRTRE